MEHSKERSTKLRKCGELSLPAVSPFNFKYTVYKPSHFPTRLEEFDEASETFYRTFRLNEDKILGLKMRDLEKKQGESGIFLEVYSTNELDRQDLDYLEKHVNGAYGLKENINEFYEYVKSDKKLNAIIDDLRGMRNSCFENLYEILNIAVMLQNATVQRTEQMMQSMLSNFGEYITYDNKELFVFYVPEEIVKTSTQRLRELKVGYRANFLMELAKYFLTNKDLDEKLKNMSFEEAKNKLIEIKGVGPYTANLVLFAYLKHPNFINFDVWNKKIFAKFLFDDEDMSLEEINNECERRWGKYKGYAALYIIENFFIKKPKFQY